MRGWENDKTWTDLFLPEIKAILGQHLIGAAPLEEDQHRNTDLIVLRMEAVRIACRIRRAVGLQGQSYLEKYGTQFTIRAGRPSGQETELTKIIKGWGHYFFYGFADERLVRWALGDLNIFRLWFNRELARRKGVAPGESRPNGDGSSHFRAFNWADLPTDFLIAASWATELSTPFEPEVRNGTPARV
jgi:hypothetical protein